MKSLITIKKILFAAFFLVAMTVGAQQSRLVFNPAQPVAGQPLQLSYTPLPKMTGYSTIKGIAYTYRNFRWYGQDITVTQDADMWKGSFNIPSDAAFVAFKFMADTISDNNNGLTFGMMVADAKGKNMPGSYVAWGLLRSARYNQSIPGYIDCSKTKEVSDTAVYYWTDNEIQRNPSTAVRLAPLYIQSMQTAGISGFKEAKQRCLQFLLKIGTEDALISAFNIAGYDDNALRDSLNKVILDKYPDGKYALHKELTEYRGSNDMKVMRDDYVKLLQRFPYSDEKELYLEQFGSSYENIYSAIIIADFFIGNDTELKEYMNKLSFYGCSNMFYKLVEIAHSRGDKTDAQLLPLADMIVACADKARTRQPLSVSYMSPSEWAAETDKNMAKYVAETYSEILKNTGNLDRALTYGRMALEVTGFKRSNVNDNMADLLNRKGMKNELKELLEKSVYYNQLSVMQDSLLRKLYNEEHGSDDGYEAYVAKLKNPEEGDAIKAAVEKYRVQGIMPSWSLTDARGKTVNSSMLKGKVYVLDFWANWCVPCKASLPGMKMAADHYKNDPNVEFLFIDTQESGADYKARAAKYLKDHGLDLHLVFDGNRKGSKTNDLLSSQVMKMFTTSGIPLKVVVDATGRVRFLAVGYKGSPSALRDEMVEMVEQAKK